ncbi:alpha/beta hydrolase [Paenibacillus ferrarius]|uniref:Alpha/beta hydrolase n=2 Tax=Paenibacillus ferrarius TaxID=1469647 RepID=A0A1V4HGB0_9BACL|nr:alpha/beta hydrolase [Paenibacillus ferrarius]OPH53616.1 alpha/beta hydrolase [Paenibacillus ferrarius]
MKKIGKIILKTLGIIAILLALFITIVFIYNVISSKVEQGKIETYGQLIPVDGKHMNVVMEGKGEETVVLLPGLGTVAPGIDFKPLIKELSPFYKVVVIEPFGYGLSDVTEKERSTANIVSEIHQDLQSLQIDRYILMGHSISGIYGIDYVNKYANEVSAFIGIDSSVPTQSGTDVEIPTQLIKLLQKSGFARLQVELSANPYDSLPYDDKSKEQIKFLAYKNNANPSVLNEMKQVRSNFKEAEKLIFPKNLPVLLFVQANVDPTIMPNWIPLHEDQVKDSAHGKVILLEGGHNLHHTKSKELVESFREFMKK